MSPRRVAPVVVLAACAGTAAPGNRVPVGTRPDNDCVPAAVATRPPTSASFKGDTVFACFDSLCFALDLAAGTVVRMDEEEVGELGPFDMPPHVDVRTRENAIEVCDGAACASIQVPGTDNRTISAVASADGALIHALVRRPDLAVETYDRGAHRVARIALAGDPDKMWSIDRIATVVLARETTPLDDFRVTWRSTLIEPIGGRKRELGQGTAVELDPHTVLAIERDRATILDAQTFAVRARFTVTGRGDPDGGPAGVAASNGVRAALVLSDPPRVVEIDPAAHRFTTRWRLPVCE